VLTYASSVCGTAGVGEYGEYKIANHRQMRDKYETNIHFCLGFFAKKCHHFHYGTGKNKTSLLIGF